MNSIKLFEETRVRSHWDEAEEQWYFSVVDVVEALTDSTDAKDYWYKMKKREKLSGVELSTICRHLKIESSGGKKYNTDCANSQATRQIAETDKAKGLTENARASKKGGAIAKNARLALESKTGKKVVTGENFLPPAKEKMKIGYLNKYEYNIHLC